MFPEAGTTNCSEKRRTDNAAGRQHSLSAFHCWQNNNIARQEAEQAQAQANLPLENRSITLQYADVGELAKAGEKLLSAKGSMTVDKRTNRLLLRDNKTALSALEQWVAQMDLPVGQVELSAHIVTINEKVCVS